MICGPRFNPIFNTINGQWLVELTLAKENGEFINLMFNSLCSIQSLKQTLSRTLIDIPPNRQVIFVNGTSYGDYQYLCDLGLDPNTKYELRVTEVSDPMVEELLSISSVDNQVVGPADVVDPTPTTSSLSIDHDMPNQSNAETTSRNVGPRTRYSIRSRHSMSDGHQPALALRIKTTDGQYIRLENLNDRGRCLSAKACIKCKVGQTS